MQPIANLTTFFTVLRSVTDDEDQLDRINEIQQEFFDSIGNTSPTKDKLAETLNSKRSGLEEKKVSPHYKGITAMMDEFANIPKTAETPSLLFGDSIGKFDSLLTKINEHREII